MKCDNLKIEYLLEDRVITSATQLVAYYRALEVDEAISELKIEIDKLRKENESLKHNVDSDLFLDTLPLKASEEEKPIKEAKRWKTQN